jgi:hypothetical protein
VTGPDGCARCVLLGRVCPACEASRALDVHMAWMSEHFTSESDWPQGEVAADLATRNLAVAKRQEEAAAELEQMAIVPQDIELAGAMRQTAAMLRVYAMRHGGASGQN